MFRADWINPGGDISLPLDIRREIFCGEQDYEPDVEFDDVDNAARHLLITENGEAVGTGRLFSQDGVYKLGRICVRGKFRGQGFADLIIRLMLDKAISIGAKRFYICSQVYVKPLYTKFGFTQQGEAYVPFGDHREHVDLYAEADDIVFPSECGNAG